MRLTSRANAVPLGAVFLVCGVVIAIVVGVLHLDRMPVAFCLFKAVTGLPCLTCGTTRAFARLVSLDVPGALAMNPLAAAAALTLLPWGVADLVLMRKGSALALEVSPAAAPLLRVAAVSLLAANWAYLIVVGR